MKKLLLFIIAALLFATSANAQWGLIDLGAAAVNKAKEKKASGSLRPPSPHNSRQESQTNHIQMGKHNHRHLQPCDIRNRLQPQIRRRLNEGSADCL